MVSSRISSDLYFLAHEILINVLFKYSQRFWCKYKIFIKKKKHKIDLTWNLSIQISGLNEKMKKSLRDQLDFFLSPQQLHKSQHSRLLRLHLHLVHSVLHLYEIKIFDASLATAFVLQIGFLSSSNLSHPHLSGFSVGRFSLVLWYQSWAWCKDQRACCFKASVVIGIFSSCQLNFK